MSGPLCKVCGKPIPKVTTTHEFGRDKPLSWGVGHPEKPTTRAEVQRLVNGVVLSTTKSWRGDGPQFIQSANVWDGESYAWGGHFHAQSCAAQFGESMAGLFPTYSMPAYKAAMAARKETA